MGTATREARRHFVIENAIVIAMAMVASAALGDAIERTRPVRVEAVAFASTTSPVATATGAEAEGPGIAAPASGGGTSPSHEDVRAAFSVMRGQQGGPLSSERNVDGDDALSAAIEADDAPSGMARGSSVVTAVVDGRTFEAWVRRDEDRDVDGPSAHLLFLRDGARLSVHRLTDRDLAILARSLIAAAAIGRIAGPEGGPVRVGCWPASDCDGQVGARDAKTIVTVDQGSGDVGVDRWRTGARVDRSRIPAAAVEAVAGLALRIVGSGAMGG